MVCSLSAQSRYAFVAGLNRGDINVSSTSVTVGNDLTVSNDSEPDLGIRLGIETKLFNWNLGLMFTQRNYKEKAVGTTTFSDIELIDIQVDTKIDRSVQMDYLSLYGTYPLVPGERVQIFGGLELGGYLKGSVNIKEESEATIAGEDIEIPAASEENNSDLTNTMSTDYGLLVGGNFIISSSISIRASYYMGLADMFKDIDPSEEEEYVYSVKGQHRGIQFALVYLI